MNNIMSLIFFQNQNHVKWLQLVKKSENIQKIRMILRPLNTILMFGVESRETITGYSESLDLYQSKNKSLLMKQNTWCKLALNTE